MNPKQTNLSKYMNFTKKNKSIIPNFIDSSNKYPNYLQSSLKEDDLLLLKRKIKSYSKIHSHSSNNTNKTKKAKKSSHVSNILSNDFYLLKPKKANNLIDKSSKNQLMLTSVNNSSIIQSSKDKGHSYSINNISNYQSNQNNINNISQKKIRKKSRLQKSGNINNNSVHKKNFVENEIYNQKKSFNNQIEYNIIKKNNKDKKYSLTSINSRKNSVDKDKDKDKDKEKGDIMKKLHKLNFNGLFKNKNYNNKLEYSSKNSSKNIINLNNKKKLYIDDFFNIKKKGKYINKFLESYFKAPQSSNNRKVKKYINNNSKNKHKSTNKNNQNSTNNNTISKNNNNNFSSTNCSPINNNKFFKTAKVSPRTSHPKKKQELQSHRVNMQNKISGNILDFYNNYKKNSKSGKNGLLYGNSFFIDNNSNYINKTNSQINKKKKKISMNLNMNMNINSSNHNNNSYSKSKNKVVVNNNFPKCSSLNKIKKNNYISNNNNNAYKINNNSFINKKIINPNVNNNKKYNNQNQVNSNIINNCQININNINYNQNFLQKNNHIINDKILNLFKKKNLVDLSNSKMNKIFSQSQQKIILIKKSENKNFTSNNSPINKNSKVIKISNKGSDNSKEYLNKSKHSANKSSQIQKSKVKQYESCKSSREHLNKNNLNNEEDIKDEKRKGKDKENNNKENKCNNSSKEINKLKINLEGKPNKENNINNIFNESINKYLNSISGMSSTTRDSNYYMEKCNSLSKYIKEYYNKYKKYPPTDLNFYLYGRLIGQGAFGKVNIGLNILTGRVVAIKSFYKKDLSKNGENMRKILYETNLMKKLNHPNITKILEMFEDDDYILISMEYINGGNLFSFVKKRRKLSEKTAKFLFRQIILGIKHIHSNKIVHRDIKLENILIDLNNNIKICDFGIGRILTSSKQLLHDKCGTPMYMAPEILLSSKTQGYEGFPVDIWSSGISLYIMLSGTLPFNFKNNENSSIDEESNNNLELQYSIVNKEPKHIEKISDEARDLLKGLLNKNPNKRLTIDQILEHPWLKSDEKINNKKYHLFTKAEMIVLSKTYIDYRNAVTDDLKENFTISNLKVNESRKKGGEKKLKNITSKSSLLAPYNTLIQDSESIIEFDLDDSFDDLNNSNINLENDIIVINNKVKEFNLNYELNNNGECDNGMLINTKTGTISSSFNNKSENQLTNRSRQRNNEDEDLFGDDNDKEDQEEELEKKINKILDEIEKIGYDKEYVLNCVNKNILCHAFTVFYLMLNYKNI